MNFTEKLQNELTEAKALLAQGKDREVIRQTILGRKGSFSALLKEIPTLDAEERRSVGTQVAAVKEALEQLLTEPSSSVAKASSDFDPTIPAYQATYGSVHPISAFIDELVGIFEQLSFDVVEGNEIVSDKENFESLNFSKDHPARESHDTFYLEIPSGSRKEMLLRTHTSSVQVKELQKRAQAGRLPARFVVPGKTYRRDSDATHSPMFHQLEGVMVDTQTTLSDLRGVLDYVARRLFGNRVETRFRTHYFPFTEPSAEMDIRWVDPATKKAGAWIEWMGCGMIHPAVLEAAKINPKVYQGWAFGMGIERPVMIRKQVPDLRSFFENSLEFLDQFNEQV